MNATASPRVSIGLPVRNGENFLVEALDSLLAQSFEDFELVISDNASTDATEEICRTYADRDKRIQYSRTTENIGGAPNHNRVFELSRGEYFKWASHDDVCHPEFLLKCVDVLDRDPSVVVCYPRTMFIDEEGRPLETREPRPHLASGRSSLRFKDVVHVSRHHPIFGLMRSEVLRETPLLGRFAHSDMALLAELSLNGPFHEVEEVLFSIREHQLRSVRAFDIRKPHRFAVWFDPANEGKLIFPMWKLFGRYLSVIARAPVPWSERVRCYLTMIRWPMGRWRGLVRDLLFAGRWMFRSVR